MTIPHLRLPQDVYTRLYAATSNHTEFQAILYGVCEECLGQGLVARVKGILPYRSHGTDFESMLTSIVARPDMTVLGVAVIPDERTLGLATAHEIAASYLLTLQTTLVKVVAAARLHLHSNDAYFTHKIAKECSAWFRDLIVLVGGQSMPITIKAGSSSASSSPSSLSSDKYTSTSLNNRLDDNDSHTFGARLRFFVNPSISIHDVSTMMRQQSQDNVVTAERFKNASLVELTNATIHSRDKLDMDGEDVKMPFTRLERMPLREEEEEETTNILEDDEKGRDGDGEAEDEDEDEDNEEEEDNEDNIEEVDENEMEIEHELRLKEDDDDDDEEETDEDNCHINENTNNNEDTVEHDVNMSDGLCIASRNDTTQEIDNSFASYISSSGNEGVNTERLSTYRRHKGPHKSKRFLDGHIKETTASRSTAMKLPRLITPSLYEKFTVEKGQGSAYLQRVLGEAR
ncbi:hypothetical protein BDF19DRAFT_184918 [Syncephalis fuscata]|nr:hypothetical protein BDF19DRAFT_184918 [Syncephalis fuscata]